MTVKDRKYAAVVFGASGFTGRYVALELARSFAASGEKRPWAIAGRSETKLKPVLKEVTGSAGNKQTVDIVLADVNDESSLQNMLSQCDVVLNCVGPFRFYGEQVVKACVESQTNYVDISGEPQFLESVQSKYHDRAADAGIKIVGSCGFDSIPCDIGVEHLRQEFPGKLTSVESYLTITGGAKGHYATYESVVHSFANRGELSSLRKAIFPTRIQYEGKSLPKRGQAFFSKEENKWTIPFAGSDASVVRRTQYFLQNNADATPIRYSPYFCLPSFVSVIGTMLFGIMIMALSGFSFGRKILLKFPKLFSFGVFSHEGPSEEDISRTSGIMSFYGYGITSDDDNKSVEKKMKIYFPEPGYDATSIFVVQSALTILYDNLKYSGILTAGAAFKGTKLIDRLKKRGIKFVFY